MHSEPIGPVRKGGDGHIWDDTARADITGCICRVGGAWWCPVHGDEFDSTSAEQHEANGCIVLVSAK